MRHENATLVPGLVDLQVNGGAGGAYDDADPAARRRATEFHLRAGTTSLLATLVSAPLDHLEAATARLLGEISASGPLLGVHLEGPFLVEAKRGAHDAAHLCDPTPERVSRLLDVAEGALRMVTLAPERARALEAVERFAGAGAVVAAGHSRATLAEVRAAIERGLSFVTHIGNASDWPARVLDPALGRRVSEPNLVGAFLIDRRLRGSLILDGHHLHPELARVLVELRGAEAIALVSDATPAAGLPPGRYRMGGLDAEIHAGRARDDRREPGGERDPAPRRRARGGPPGGAAAGDRDPHGQLRARRGARARGPEGLSGRGRRRGLAGARTRPFAPRGVSGRRVARALDAQLRAGSSSSHPRPVRCTPVTPRPAAASRRTSCAS